MTNMSLSRFAGKWGRVALHFLIFSAIAGVVLRYYNVSSISGLNYKYLLHTHSHIALLGWMYLAYGTVLVKEFLPGEADKFNKIFMATLFSVLGMLISFPFQGYGFVSILFSTLFLFTSYWFVLVFYQSLKAAGNKSLAAKWIYWGLFFLIISGIGPWALGPIMVFGKPHGILYNLAIYYYLHFLYNGFFILAMFGIVQRRVDNSGIEYNKSIAERFFQLTVYAIIPAYALSTLWTNPPAWVYLVAGVAGVMQLVALFYGWPVLRLYMQQSIKNNFYRVIFWFILAAYGLKVLMQAFSAVPAIADYVYSTRVFTAIGYIHLVMLGVLTLFILTYFTVGKIFRDHSLARTGIIVFLTGLILSEFFLFMNGLFITNQQISISHYAQLMVWSSALMPLGLTIFWVLQIRNKPVNEEVTVSET
jgi:hypothetical protein